jgi:hypothetical protein
MKSYLIIVLAIIFSGQVHSRKLNFCSITLNSSNEIEYFKNNLSSNEFEFTELTSETDNFDQDWMKDACQRHKSLSCDVLLISGHFAGEVFFGVNGKSGRRVFTHHLLEKVCNESCDNILKNPKLVFLFGGHTLSDKTSATRKEKEQLASAVSNEIGAGAHQRLAEARYGIYGKAYLHQMKRVFGKNATLLGFDGKGVKGRHTKIKLKKFLSKIKNLKDSIENSTNSSGNNHNTKETVQSISPIIAKSFIKSFGKVGGSVCQNFLPSDDLTYSNLNSTICLITNESSGYIYNKIEVIESVFKSPEQSELVLPWIEEFFRKHPPLIGSPNFYPNKLDNEQFIELKKSFVSTNTQALLETSVEKSDGGFTKFQILSTMRYLDLLNDTSFVSQAKPLLKKELRKLRFLDQDTIDLLCQLWPTLEIINKTEDIFTRYHKKWNKQISKLNKCIEHEKQRVRVP